ncbi:uncharacterized protein LOC115629447 isoform X2 [Scaptodrosophila lebanonensis]|uniref:Uncharacterized protein LOC115629447 isoform X2 n=1 Tax=Drosophila lebanonensis TaxID=7225 RepID=A0A6J2U1K7_DROLE|nr:uncharacterized protein LOC115629447 isoform X2 [Scaptodrosophila lebanonensis]
MDYIVKAYKDWKLHSQFQEIVPDMDDTEFMFNEKQSIRDSARTLKKYGSTCSNNRSNETLMLIRHEVEKNDTLQGIALKYNCTMEQIRRTNRLFASDSLFLRQFLLVPVEKASPYYPQASLNISASAAGLADALAVSAITTKEQLDAVHNSNNRRQSNTYRNSDYTNSNSSSSSVGSSSNCQSTRPGPLHARPYSIAGEVLVHSADEDPALMINHKACSSKQSKSMDSVSTMTPEEENRKCMNDFLNKIDNTISESRKYVERSKDMINYQMDVDVYVNNIDLFPHRRNNRPPQQLCPNSTHSGNSEAGQQLFTAQTRRVQNSLKRLEKQQDEFFEL